MPAALLAQGHGRRRCTSTGAPACGCFRCSRRCHDRCRWGGTDRARTVTTPHYREVWHSSPRPEVAGLATHTTTTTQPHDREACTHACHAVTTATHSHTHAHTQPHACPHTLAIRAAITSRTLPTPQRVLQLPHTIQEVRRVGVRLHRRPHAGRGTVSSCHLLLLCFTTVAGVAVGPRGTHSPPASAASLRRLVRPTVWCLLRGLSLDVREQRARRQGMERRHLEGAYTRQQGGKGW